LTRAEIIRTLRKYRYDPEHRRGKQGCTVYNLAALSNCDLREIQNVLRYGFFNSHATVHRLSRACEMIENGEVRFVFNRDSRTKRGKDEARGAAGGREKWRIKHVQRPVRRPPPEDRITRAADHREWARCRTCQGEKWAAVVIAGAPWYVCLACSGPPHWPGMGARKADAVERLEMFESLVREDFSQL
jgi:hypothetical protein